MYSGSVMNLKYYYYKHGKEQNLERAKGVDHVFGTPISEDKTLIHEIQFLASKSLHVGPEKK